MLAALARLAREVLEAELSLEEPMACGVGVCLGCVVELEDGHLVPVVQGRAGVPDGSAGAGVVAMSVELSTRVGALALANPILTASGTFGYGLDLLDLCPPERLGGIVTKGLSPQPRAGNRRRASSRPRPA